MNKYRDSTINLINTLKSKKNVLSQFLILERPPAIHSGGFEIIMTYITIISIIISHLTLIE